MITDNMRLMHSVIEAARRSVLALLICACPGGLASAAADGSDRQEELLAWVHSLRYQARDEQALAVCEMILAADPTCSEALVWRGIILLGTDEFDAAHESFSEALRHGDRPPLALVGRARAREARGERVAAQRDTAEASTLCSRAIDRGGADALTWYTRGVARLLQENTGALQDILTAIGLDASLVDASLEASHIYRARGRLTDALSRLDRAVEVRPDYAVGFLARARINFELERYEDALADCDRALEINPGYARAWHNRGLVKIQREEFEEAVGDFTEAIAAQPGYASAHFYRGQAYAALDDAEAAREDLETARELSPWKWPGPEAAEMLDELQRQAAPDR